MKILKDTAFICAPSTRSRAYAQAMQDVNIYPKDIIYMPGEEPKWSGVNDITVPLSSSESDFRFKPAVTTKEIFSNKGLNEFTLPDCDINSKASINYLSSLESKIIIYSGFGGVILRKDLLSIGKKFLHIHGGYAPAYRGSTAFYYSILDEKSVAATALWLEFDIDTGPILDRKKHPLIPGYDIDNVIDPVIRADLLRDILLTRIENEEYPKGYYDNQNSFTYFVIHPLLKHIAMSQCDLIK